MKKRITMTALWLAALVCCLALLDRGMRRDDSERKYGAFFEEKQEDEFCNREYKIEQEV